MNKDDSEILVLLGSILFEHGSVKTSLRFYKEALKINPKDVAALIFIGNAKYEK